MNFEIDSTAGGKRSPRIGRSSSWILIAAFLLSSPPPLLSQENSDEPRTHEVKMILDAFVFEPPLLEIKPGDTVIWSNEGDVVHFLASIPGAGTNDKEILSPMMKPGDKYSHTFANAGDYPYMCFIHNQMMGAVVVEGDGGETPLPPQEGTSSIP
jgi:plastocyanin